jgi:hypothetical protein
MPENACLVLSELSKDLDIPKRTFALEAPLASRVLQKLVSPEIAGPHQNVVIKLFNKLPVVQVAISRNEFRGLAKSSSDSQR